MIRPTPDPVDGQPSPAHDAHGRAALLLVESLIHGLIDCASLTVGDAIAIIDGAAEIDDELRGTVVVPGQPLPSSLLTPLANSLRLDTNS